MVKTVGDTYRKWGQGQRCYKNRIFKISWHNYSTDAFLHFHLDDRMWIALTKGFGTGRMALRKNSVLSLLCFSLTLTVLPLSQHFWHHICGGFSPIKQLSATSADCSTIELNSNSMYLEAASDPTDQGLSPTRLPSPHFKCQSQVQVVICASDQL